MDGNEYHTVATLSSKGNSAANTYVTQDPENVFTGNAYYRIKAISISGVVQYSNTIQYRIANNNATVSAWPSPFSKVLSIQSGKGYESGMTVQISDMSGRLLINKKFDASDGVIVTLPEAATLQNGIYLLRVSSLDGSATSAMRVVKGQ